MAKAVIYCRFSSNDKEDSLGSQAEDCEAYCEAKGYQVLAILKEDTRGVGGDIWHTETLQKIEKMAEAGEFDVLVCRDLARFARDVDKSRFYKDVLEQNGVSLEFLRDSHLNSTSSTMFTYTIYSALVEEERRMIALRLKEEREKRLSRNSYITHGSSMFGYDAVRNHRMFEPVVIKEEAAIIKQIFELVARGMSANKVCAYLNENNIPTYSQLRKGKNSKWYVSNVLD